MPSFLRNKGLKRHLLAYRNGVNQYGLFVYTENLRFVNRATFRMKALAGPLSPDLSYLYPMGKSRNRGFLSR